MKPPVRHLVAALFCVFAAMSRPNDTQAQYRTVNVESLNITVDSEWATQGAPGYIPIRFDITNLGLARTIEIEGHGTRYGTNVTAAALNISQELRLRTGD